MDFEGSDRDEGNCDKRRRHGLSLDEIEGLFVLILPDSAHSRNERRFKAIGSTASGRRVFVVFAMRAGAIRPISARYMHQREAASYEEAYPDVRNR